MPIYEHKCSECGQEEEKLLPLGHGPQIHCGQPMIKMISRTSPPVFKGSGFYATEYGDQMENLKPSDHKHRLAKEMKDRGLTPNRPADRAEGAPLLH